ncbi:hypothetical protein [Dinoroseobacter sp. S375]|uniref:hypothetical protein n=1 Tax=Dinoroseobacter sp. S375 TaxID=3415136 RepID=UPI003C7B64A5
MLPTRSARALALSGLLAAPAYGQSGNLALDLGSLLAAGEVCELGLEEQAVVDFIRRNADPSDIRFISTLSSAIRTRTIIYSGMEGVERAAVCEAARVSLQNYRLIK